MIKNTSIITLFFIVLTHAVTVKADVIGFEAGVDYWNYSMSGDVSGATLGSGKSRVDFDDENDVSFFALIEHPLPFLPNVKLQQNNLKSDGLLRLSDAGFAPGSTGLIDVSIDLSHTDLILYYEILDNWVNLDVGISAKYFDGSSRLRMDAQTTDSYSFDEWVALAYAKAQFDLPLTGFSAAASLEALSLGDNEVTDLDLALKYNAKMGLGASLGYRVLDVDLDAGNNFNGDFKTDGFYLGVHLDF